MSQTVVPAFYSTKKRFKELGKSLENPKNEKLSEVPTETVVTNLKKPIKKASKAKSKGQKVNKITSYLKSDTGSTNLNVEKEIVHEKVRTPRTPKRNLTPEEITPSKKKPVSSFDAVHSQNASPAKSKSSLLLTPQRHDSVASRKLLLHSPSRYGSPKKIASPSKNQLTPQKVAAYENLNNKDLASIVEQSRTKILFSGRLEELKKSLESFTNVSSKTKEFQANSFKITSVVSSAKSSEKEPVSIIKGEPAYKKFSSLAAPKAESSFVLPYKYKLLGETFRCLDTVVKMIHNRKEKVTFDKVKQGVQDMMKKNFLMNHLGQIMTVFPSAYSLEYEKCDSYTIKKNSSPYQLIITPIIKEDNGSVSDVPVKGKKKKQSAFIAMNPQHLLERKHIFEQNLLKITKTHHQEFLKRKKFPAVSDDKILRWHPDFPVDSVPNIAVAALPEEPELKVCTAKDVLNKLKGSVRGRVGKALQSVADELQSETSDKKTSESDTQKTEQVKKQSSALKGICTDLLEKIRARESAKILESMTRSTQDEKRLEMLERIPKIVHILWHYFIAERKAAVPVDLAVEKILHSFNSLSTPDSVKEHLDLIRETMPGWLSLIKIPKGEYLTIDKKKDINVMLRNIK